LSFHIKYVSIQLMNKLIQINMYKSLAEKILELNKEIQLFNTDKECVLENYIFNKLEMIVSTRYLEFIFSNTILKSMFLDFVYGDEFSVFSLEFKELDSLRYKFIFLNNDFSYINHQDKLDKQTSLKDSVQKVTDELVLRLKKKHNLAHFTSNNIEVRDILLVVDFNQFKIYEKNKPKVSKNLKKATLGTYFTWADSITEMSRRLDKGAISQTNKKNLIRTLSDTLNLSKQSLEKVFINENGKCGIRSNNVEIVGEIPKIPKST